MNEKSVRTPFAALVLFMVSLAAFGVILSGFALFGQHVFGDYSQGLTARDPPGWYDPPQIPGQSPLNSYTGKPDGWYDPPQIFSNSPITGYPGFRNGWYDPPQISGSTP